LWVMSGWSLPDMEYFEDSDPSANAEIGCKMPFLDGHCGPWVILGHPRCPSSATRTGMMNPEPIRLSFFNTCRERTII
jgi:hypothetical protein